MTIESIRSFPGPLLLSRWVIRLSAYNALQPSSSQPLMANGPIYGFEALRSKRDLFPHQRLLRQSFRRALVKQLEIKGAIRHPEETPLLERTDDWEYMCACINSFSSQTPQEQGLLLRVLCSLGFHALTIEFGKQILESTLNDKYHAQQAIATCCSLIASTDGAADRKLEDTLVSLVRKTTKNSMEHFTALRILIVHYGRTSTNIAAAVELSRELLNTFDGIKSSLSDFPRYMAESMMWRANSLIPFQLKNMTEMSRQLERCEMLAEAARGVALTPEERSIAAEGFHPVLETRAREAVTIGDVELAHDRIKRLLILDPDDSKVHIQAGESWWRLGQPEQALKHFEMAIQLGPPGLILALFLSGAAKEALGDTKGAAYAHDLVMRYDPSSISSRQALQRLSNSNAVTRKTDRTQSSATMTKIAVRGFKNKM